MAVARAQALKGEGGRCRSLDSVEERGGKIGEYIKDHLKVDEVQKQANSNAGPS